MLNACHSDQGLKEPLPSYWTKRLNLKWIGFEEPPQIINSQGISFKRRSRIKWSIHPQIKKVLRSILNIVNPRKQASLPSCHYKIINKNKNRLTPSGKILSHTSESSSLAQLLGLAETFSRTKISNIAFISGRRLLESKLTQPRYSSTWHLLSIAWSLGSITTNEGNCFLVIHFLFRSITTGTRGRNSSTLLQF